METVKDCVTLLRVCVWHIMEAWDSQYHVVEAAPGRLTNLSVVLLKHFAASIRLVRLNVPFSFLFFFFSCLCLESVQPEMIQV